MAPPDAWDDDWETAADKPDELAPKKVPAKVTKAQRRAQQAEFNRQLWQQADGEPEQPNYFLETRNAIPKSDFKPPPRLLSRKGPNPASNGVNESSDEEGEGKKKPLTVEEQRALAVKEREEKQRKYEERRQELFGTPSNAAPSPKKQSSTNSSPAETPLGSRSSTPNRGRGGRGADRKAELGRPMSSASSLSMRPSSVQPSSQARGEKELYDPNYTSRKPNSGVSRISEKRENVIEPIRSPRGPDGSGRGGHGFAPRGGKAET